MVRFQPSAPDSFDINIKKHAKERAKIYSFQLNSAQA